MPPEQAWGERVFMSNVYSQFAKYMDSILAKPMDACSDNENKLVDNFVLSLTQTARENLCNMLEEAMSSPSTVPKAHRDSAHEAAKAAMGGNSITQKLRSASKTAVETEFPAASSSHAPAVKRKQANVDEDGHVPRKAHKTAATVGPGRKSISTPTETEKPVAPKKQLFYNVVTISDDEDEPAKPTESIDTGIEYNVEDSDSDNELAQESAEGDSKENEEDESTILWRPFGPGSTERPRDPGNLGSLFSRRN
ncbi:hypothetical protein HBI81_243720 [Parastagonospora nodorum]|nr:hypothetical protein HBI18_246220 [Parastagonospora nodorum]KAH6511546.1 hypothetical protein HBI81_243720 [Parastagonospora nodorum]